MFPTSADVCVSCEPEIMRTEAGIALWELSANLLRAFTERCFLGLAAERLVPFCADLELLLFFDDLFGEPRLDDCLLGLGRPPPPPD